MKTVYQLAIQTWNIQSIQRKSNWLTKVTFFLVYWILMLSQWICWSEIDFTNTLPGWNLIQCVAAYVLLMNIDNKILINGLLFLFVFFSEYTFVAQFAVRVSYQKCFQVWTNKSCYSKLHTNEQTCPAQVVPWTHMTYVINYQCATHVHFTPNTSRKLLKPEFLHSSSVRQLRRWHNRQCELSFFPQCTYCPMSHNEEKNYQYRILSGQLQNGQNRTRT